MSLAEHIVDNPEEFDRLLIPKSDLESDGNTRGKQGQTGEEQPDQSEQKQEDDNVLWKGSNV